MKVFALVSGCDSYCFFTFSGLVPRSLLSAMPQTETASATHGGMAAISWSVSPPSGGIVCTGGGGAELDCGGGGAELVCETSGFAQDCHSSREVSARDFEPA